VTPVPRPAAFLDRDGTLIEERSYPTRVEDIVPLPGAGRALRRLKAAGFLTIVLTNQSAIARGMLDEEHLGALHEHLSGELAGEGGAIDDVLYCPHHPDGSNLAYAFRCDCRKPGEGLLAMALQRHDIDLSRSLFIGDQPRDMFVGAGKVGGRILVTSGHPIDDTSSADMVAPSLEVAVDWLLDGVPDGVAAITPGAAPSDGAD